MSNVIQLGEACTVRRGKTITKKTSKQGDIPVIAGGKKPAYFHNEHNREAGTITISGSGASAGLVNYWNIPIFASDCSTVETNDKNQNSKFIYYFLKSKQDFIFKNLTSGAAQPHVYAKDIAKINLPLIPLEKQNLIVAKLDIIYDEINKLDLTTKKIINNLNSLYNNTLSNFFYSKKYKKIKLRDVCLATQGVQIPKNQQLKSSKKGYLRYLYISDFSHDKNIKYIENKHPKKIVHPSDIIVVNTGASAGSIFKGIPGILSNNLFKVSPNKDLINSDFLYYFVTSNLFKNFQKKIIRGTANPHMGHENFLNTPINLPTLNEQEDIIASIIELKNNFEKLNQNYLNKINLLNQLKTKKLLFYISDIEK